MHAKVRGDKSVRAWSGYKVANAKTSFKSIELDYDETAGGAFLGAKERKAPTGQDAGILKLHDDLKAVGNESTTLDDGTVVSPQQRRNDLVTAFLRDVYRPQPGDIMDIRTDGAEADTPNRYGVSEKGIRSHTTMIEQLDGFTIYTVEGNTAGARVSGRTLDLTDYKDVARIIMFARPSLASGKTTADPNAPAPAPSGITRDDLIQPLEAANGLLKELATKLDVVNDTSYDARIAEITKHPS